MTAPDAPEPRADDDMLDLAALLHDVDIIRRHRELKWGTVADETGVSQGRLSDLMNGKIRPGLLTYQRLTRWIDPAGVDYLTAGAAPARIPKADKVPPRLRPPGEVAA
jgi:transcriptional regulator with XRE-family HTH domain